jgi:Asp/Glu/hydantoin racemase
MTANRSRVVLLHTVPGLPAVFTELVRTELAPPGAGTAGLDAVHIVDETLLQDTIAHGLRESTRRLVAEYAAFAERSGAAAVLVTCSSIGAAAELARAEVGIPVFRVDEPMAAAAVTAGRRIGVLATLAATLGPTRDLLAREAARRAEPCEITTSVCPGAFDALRAGDAARHDEIVGAEVTRLAAGVDALVLAQASMARVVDGLPADRVPVPVFTSPRSGIGQLRAYAVS